MDFHAAASSALCVIRQTAGIDITYHRGTAWVRLQAIPGRTAHEAKDRFGTTTEQRSRDYTVKACDLKLGSAVITPQRGDYIEVVVRGTVQRYELSRPDGGEQLWQPADHAGEWIRIHTKRAPGQGGA